MQSNVGEIIDKLAAKLSVPAAHLWAVLVKQARLEAVTRVLWLVVFGLAVYLALRLHRRVRAWAAPAERDGYRYDNDDRMMAYYFVVCIAGGALTISGIIVCDELFKAIGYLLNPEYYALKTILSALK